MKTENLRIRVGHGYDLHRLEPLAPAGKGRPLILGGVRLDSDRGPVSRSDGDVLLHAITDAILGALALPDIGQLFPDSDARNEGRDSADFLRESLRLAEDRGWKVGNLDSTVVAERPKLGPAKEIVRASIAALLDIASDHVNIKGKTHEGVDAVGEGRAIEAHAVVTMVPTPRHR